MLTVLFAEGFNVEEMLASGVIGAGIAGTVGVGIRLKQEMVKREKEAKEAGTKAKVGGYLLKMTLLMIVGMSVIIGGIAWRTHATKANVVRR